MMNKEELIKILEQLSIEELKSFNLTYYDKKYEKYNSEIRECRTITYNFDIERELDSMRRNIDNAYETINRSVVCTVEEILRNKEEK